MKSKASPCYSFLVSHTAEENEARCQTIRHQHAETIDLTSTAIAQEPETPSTQQPKAPKRRKTILDAPVAASTLGNFLNTRIPLSGGYVPVTFSDGRRRFLNMESESSGSEIELLGTMKTRSHKPLLQDELYELVKGAEELGKMQQTLKNSLAPSASPESGGSVDNGLLWVKKYEPMGYLDLISAEVSF